MLQLRSSGGGEVVQPGRTTGEDDVASYNYIWFGNSFFESIRCVDIDCHFSLGLANYDLRKLKLASRNCSVRCNDICGDMNY